MPGGKSHRRTVCEPSLGRTDTISLIYHIIDNTVKKGAKNTVSVYAIDRESTLLQAADMPVLSFTCNDSQDGTTA